MAHGGEALWTKMGDCAHAEHAPEGLVNPAVSWVTLGAHVVAAQGSLGSCGGERGMVYSYVVTVRSFRERVCVKCRSKI